MARALKTYTTSAGFFDLAIAAPSMKAALEAWGSRSNLFLQGFAKLSDDPAIVAATLAKPGIVLRRAVGSTGRFSEHAQLPKELPVGNRLRKQTTRTAKKDPPPASVDDKDDRSATPRAAATFKKEQLRRDNERREQEMARKKDDERSKRAIATAEAALEEARRDHEARLAEIDKERAALDRRLALEDSLWRRKYQKLENALRNARSVKYS